MLETGVSASIAEVPLES